MEVALNGLCIPGGEEERLLARLRLQPWRREEFRGRICGNIRPKIGVGPPAVWYWVVKPVQPSMVTCGAGKEMSCSMLQIDRSTALTRSYWLAISCTGEPK